MPEEKQMYILDTSVMIHNPFAIHSFKNTEMIIPATVIDELNNLTTKPGEKGRNAREALRVIDNAINAQTGSNSTFQLSNHSALTIASCNTKYKPDSPMSNAEQDVAELAVKSGATVLSKKTALRILLHAKNIRASDFIENGETNKHEPVYRGRCAVYVTPDEMDVFAKTGELQLDPQSWYAYTDGSTKDEQELPHDYKLTVNEFVMLKNAMNPQGAPLLGRYDGCKIVKLQYAQTGGQIFGVKPRNIGQIFALEALMAPVDIAPLVILKGQAGTAKTFLTMAAGLQQTLNSHQYKRILVSRPNTKFDDDIGYLKGGEMEKIQPLIRPIYDNVENLMPDAEHSNGLGPADALIEQGTIVPQAMAYMRGRSINNTYIIIDECQNATVTQVKGLITRPGEGSKIIILGDPDQIDDPYLDSHSNGLSVAAECMKGDTLCWQLTFDDSECSRCKLASSAIKRLSLQGERLT